VLNIKPVLTFSDEGTVEPFKKVKGLKKAMGELAAQVAEDSADAPVALTILHGAAPHLADGMRASLDACGCQVRACVCGLGRGGHRHVCGSRGGGRRLSPVALTEVAWRLPAVRAA
jgi:fatty acid-binding protein DegV